MHRSYARREVPMTACKYALSVLYCRILTLGRRRTASRANFRAEPRAGRGGDWSRGGSWGWQVRYGQLSTPPRSD